MGNNVDKVTQHINTEYARVAAMNTVEPKPNYIILDQVLAMNEYSTYATDFSHLGTLYILNSDKNGKFTLEDFHKFLKLAAAREPKWRSRDFKSQLMAYCTLQMWKQVKSKGDEYFAKWFCRLFVENTISNIPAVRYSRSSPNTFYFLSESIEKIHKLLNLKTFYGISSLNFFVMLQQADRERAQKIENSQTKRGQKRNRRNNLIHVDIINRFACDFINGFTNLLAELGFEASSISDN
eukprot:TRINITY_DN590_c0_g3_i2.p1 TRINITY_DN590_c0_g3~~TRINITY_DN590_c0_g3_i2.p1  ORF type:complete len:238 (-),score=81.83 TRINITY_DN590_c0_g3_i2:89-802(-)